MVMGWKKYLYKLYFESREMLFYLLFTVWAAILTWCDMLNFQAFRVEIPSWEGVFFGFSKLRSLEGYKGTSFSWTWSKFHARINVSISYFNPQNSLKFQTLLLITMEWLIPFLASYTE